MAVQPYCSDSSRLHFIHLCIKIISRQNHLFYYAVFFVKAEGTIFI